MMFGPYGYGSGWGWMANASIIMLVFWILLIIGVVALVRAASLGGMPPQSRTPVEILRRRYAAGELTKEQFEGMRRDIRQGSRGMGMRGWLVVGIIAILAAVAFPVLAHPGMGPGGWSSPPSGIGQPLSMAQAEAIARQAVARSGIPGLVPMHIMEFSNNFYVAVKEKATGEGAFELLIDRYTGLVRPEPQSMMWNTKYGHMRGWAGPGYGWRMGSGYGPGGRGPGHGGPGMMGPGYGPYGGPGRPGQYATPPMSVDQAKVVAKQFLDARYPGTKTDEAIAFPGYYTIDVARDGHPIGMLSVNAYTGLVWYHVWHGSFIEEKDLD